MQKVGFADTGKEGSNVVHCVRGPCENDEILPQSLGCPIKDVMLRGAVTI